MKSRSLTTTSSKNSLGQNTVSRHKRWISQGSTEKGKGYLFQGLLRGSPKVPAQNSRSLEIKIFSTRKYCPYVTYGRKKTKIDKMAKLKKIKFHCMEYMYKMVLMESQ